MKPLSVLALVVLAGLSLAFALPQDAKPPSADEKAVRTAIEDYVLAFYEAEPERLARSLSPKVKKLGYWRATDEGAYEGPLHMNFEQATELASKWNADGKQGADLEYSIELFEVVDKTACAKLSAKWGIDYFQIAKEDDGWRIHHILWQSHPR